MATATLTDEGRRQHAIEFYEDDSGVKPCLEWIGGLDARKRRVLGTALREILQQQGIRVCGSPFGKQLGGGPVRVPAAGGELAAAGLLPRPREPDRAAAEGLRQGRGSGG